MKMSIPNFSKARVGVIGDVMLDRYCHGNANRISPEAPVPVVHVNNTEERAGGAGNVAINLSSLGIEPSLFGVIGNDNAGSNLVAQLEQAGVDNQLQKLQHSPTITKLRVLSLHQQLIRLDYEESFYEEREINIHDQMIKQLSKFGAIIISDYHKGSLHNVDHIIAAANRQNLPVFVDPKGESFDKYRGADVLTPNRAEFEKVVGRCRDEEELVAKAKGALIDHGIGALLVTRGAEGMSLIRRDKPAIHLPARAFEVRDVTGAGDTVIAVMAASVAAGEDFEVAMYLANVAASLTVQRLGAAAVSVPELRRAVRQQQFSQLGVLNQQEVLLACQDAQEHGEKIVMTNGCFDILHPGHIGYLEAARKLGDRLLVAVNSDESVARNKGPDRPLKTLADRMTVLAGLRAVDWVVPFYEDTPEALIKRITPNVLVKGVDYQIHEIAGADHVLAHGGEVKTIGPDKQWSSTALIEKLQRNNEVIK